MSLQAKLVPPFHLRSPLVAEAAHVRWAIPIVSELHDVCEALFLLILAASAIDSGLDAWTARHDSSPTFLVAPWMLFGFFLIRHHFVSVTVRTSQRRLILSSATVCSFILLGCCLMPEVTLCLVILPIFFGQQFKPFRRAPRFLAKSLVHVCLFIRGNSSRQFLRAWHTTAFLCANTVIAGVVSLPCVLLIHLLDGRIDHLGTQLGLAYVLPAGSLLIEAYLVSSELRSLFLPPLGLRDKLLPLELENVGESSEQVVVVHVSDPHLARRMTLVEDQRCWGGASRRSVDTDATFASLLASHSSTLREADVVLLTGDLTDRGEYWEWMSVSDCLDAASTDIGQKVVLVPGNHDVNITKGFGWGYREDKYLSTRKSRLVRFLSAVNHFQRAETFVFDELMNLLVPFSTFLAPFVDDLNEYVEELHQPPRRLIAMRAIPGAKEACEERDRKANVANVAWQGAFPLVVKFEQRGIAVVVLDSNRPSKAIGANSFGEVSRVQIRRLPAVCKLLEEYDMIVAMHHHLVLSDEATAGLSILGTQSSAVSNAAELIEAFPTNRRVTVFHGHHHVWAASEFRNFAMIGTPSATLGDSSVRSDERGLNPSVGFMRVELVRTGGRQIGIRSLAWHLDRQRVL